MLCLKKILRMRRAAQPDRKRSFPPLARSGARILVLGSLPGDASLAQNQYYAFPQNSFWKITGTLCGFSPDAPYAARAEALTRAGIALWDVVSAGTRPGSLDSAIRDVEPNDVARLLDDFPAIRKICCNGGTAFRLLKKYFPELFRRTDLEIIQLPSTSPAAARFSFEEKLARWRTALAGTLAPRTKN